MVKPDKVRQLEDRFLKMAQTGELQVVDEEIVVADGKGLGGITSYFVVLVFMRMASSKKLKHTYLINYVC